MKAIFRLLLTIGFVWIFTAQGTFAQVAINTDGSLPDNSAILDVKSTDKGLLLPRMTTAQRNAIATPEEGLLVFNITTGCIDYYLGGSWKSLCGGTEPVFQCGMKMTDSRDGRLYNTVQIGTQCWIAENLNIGTMIPGTTDMANNSIIEKYCYENNTANCDAYGGLYQWNEIMQYSTTPGVQGICPTGWHLPTDAEWTVLTNFLGGLSVAGGKMKTTGTIEAGTGLWFAPNTGATNSSGFTALPGGYCDFSGWFNELGSMTHFWSSTEVYPDNAWLRYFGFSFSGVGTFYDVKNYGFSVRCIRDL